MKKKDIQNKGQVKYKKINLSNYKSNQCEWDWINPGKYGWKESRGLRSRIAK